MTFTDAIKTCLKKYFVFSGRASRPEYWLFALGLVLVSGAASIVDNEIFGPVTDTAFVTTVLGSGRVSQGYETTTTYGSGPISNMFSLLTTIPFLAASFRRMHDIGRPGWHLLGSALFMFNQDVPVDAAILAVNPDFPPTISVPQPPISLFIFAACFWLFSTILTIVMLARRPQPGPNRYGPNPIEVTL